MAQYQVMTYRIAVSQTELGAGHVVTLPDGWEPLSAIRQGETALVLCFQPVGGLNVPTLTALNPDSLPAGSTPATVDVTGTGLDTTCVIYADGQPRATFFITDTHLQFTARADLAAPGESHQITVEGTGGTSNALTLTFT